MLGMVASALSFSLMGVCVKQVGGRIPAAEVVLARAIVSVALSWWLLRRAGVPPWGQRRGLLVWRGVIGTAALRCVYAALAALPGAALHWYGKQGSVLGRKLGHITVLLQALGPEERASEACQRLEEIRTIWPLPSQDWA